MAQDDRVPYQIAEEERRTVLGLVDPAAKIAQRIQNQWITPEELENEVLTGPEAVAEAECHLIQNVISHLGSFRTDSQQPHYLGLGRSDG
jgi:hypothetical protein